MVQPINAQKPKNVNARVRTGGSFSDCGVPLDPVISDARIRHLQNLLEQGKPLKTEAEDDDV